MSTLVEYFRQSPAPFLLIGAVLAVYAVWMPFYLKKRRGQQRDYLARHPGAARVFLTSRALITSEAVNIHQVNGDYPALFTEGGRSGFYARPGSNMVVVSYTYTRPGVLYKNVTKTTGEVRQEIEAEPGGRYLLGFDQDEETFTYEELPE